MKRILDFIEEHPDESWTAHSVQAALGGDRKRIQSYLYRLAKFKHIRKADLGEGYCSKKGR